MYLCTRQREIGTDKLRWWMKSWQMQWLMLQKVPSPPFRMVSGESHRYRDVISLVAVDCVPGHFSPTLHSPLGTIGRPTVVARRFNKISSTPWPHGTRRPASSTAFVFGPLPSEWSRVGHTPRPLAHGISTNQSDFTAIGEQLVPMVLHAHKYHK